MERSVSERQRDQMLRLVAKGFYNELVNYGVEKGDILRVASHLLDNLVTHQTRRGTDVPYYNGIFTLRSIVDEWRPKRQLTVQHVVLRPLQLQIVSKVAEWLKSPEVRASFVPTFPEKEGELQRYFTHPTREYFGVYYEDRPVGIVGAENIDPVNQKLEMRKLVGEPGLQRKGIGKRATFGFLYHAFMLRGVNKVYIHSRDINLSNININTRFGFELEGVFLEDLRIEGKSQDVVRMALFKAPWLEIFSESPLAVSPGSAS